MDFVDLFELALQKEDQGVLFFPNQRLRGRVVVPDHISALLVSNILQEEWSLCVDLALVERSFEEDAGKESVCCTLLHEVSIDNMEST